MKGGVTEPLLGLFSFLERQCSERKALEACGHVRFTLRVTGEMCCGVLSLKCVHRFHYCRSAQTRGPRHH